MEENKNGNGVAAKEQDIKWKFGPEHCRHLTVTAMVGIQHVREEVNQVGLIHSSAKPMVVERQVINSLQPLVWVCSSGEMIRHVGSSLPHGVKGQLKGFVMAEQKCGVCPFWEARELQTPVPLRDSLDLAPEDH